MAADFKSCSSRGPYVFGQGKRGCVGSVGAGKHGGVADLLWDDVKCFFDPNLMGSLPDVRVPEGETVLPVPRAEAVLSRSADAECPDLRVWPTTDVLAIFRFHAADEVDFDVDLRELQGQERLDVFCGFLREIGRRLWAAANNVEMAYTPADSSWLNRIEAQFTALRYFTLDGADHKEQGSMIRRYVIWRNRHADDRRLRAVVHRANVA